MSSSNVFSTIAIALGLTMAVKAAWNYFIPEDTKTEPETPTETQPKTEPETPTETYLPYEGAGFLLTYKGDVILGQRIGKETQKPTGEYEYMGGKPDPEDNNSPYLTANAELVEEVGGTFLRPGWSDRAELIHIFQPVSQKWIWCFKLELDADEFRNLRQLAIELDSWPIDETRDLSMLTCRKTPVRKALDGFCKFPMNELIENSKKFSELTYAPKETMKIAKQFSADNHLHGVDMVTDEPVSGPLRAFNYLVLAKKLSE